MKSSHVVFLLTAAAFSLTPVTGRSQGRPEAAAASVADAADPAAAAALAPLIFVASYGNDANDGSRARPKRYLQAAHNAVAGKGEILVLDSGSFRALNITKSVTITAPTGVVALVSVTGFNDGIRINSGAGSFVTLRGLTVQGGGNRQTQGSEVSSFGIYVASVGHLAVEDCAIRNFQDGLPFIPSNANAHLTVSNTSVRNCRYGIDVQSGNGELTTALVRDCRLENLGDAIYASGPGAGALVTVHNSSIVDCDTGFHFGDTGTGVAEVDGCKILSVPKLAAGTAGITITYKNNSMSDSNGNFDAVAPFK